MEKINVSDNRFSTDITIPCYDTDASFRLKPAAFMDHAQEMAYLAAQALHFGYDDLQRHHTAWVLSRMRMDFLNPPKWTDETTLYTWHKGRDGLCSSCVTSSSEGRATRTSPTNQRRRCFAPLRG